jgi:hypothetical protein
LSSKLDKRKTVCGRMPECSVPFSTFLMPLIIRNDIIRFLIN